MATTLATITEQMIRDANDTARRISIAAINKVAEAVKREAIPLIAQDLGVAQREIRPALSTRRATEMTPVAQVIAIGARIPLYEFAARQTRRGVSYRIGGTRKTIPTAFIARMRSGHIGVFRRRSTTRLPIVELFGPSVPKSFINQRVQAALRDVIGSELTAELSHGG